MLEFCNLGEMAVLKTWHWYVILIMQAEVESNPFIKKVQSHQGIPIVLYSLHTYQKVIV